MTAALFGDILSDVAAAVAGSIGIAPSGNLNPEREYPSMFEPVHGSAPDIAGQGIANPIGAIWSGAQMLEHLGEQEAAAAVLAAIEQMLAGGGPRTRDLGGTATTATSRQSRAPAWPGAEPRRGPQASVPNAARSPSAAAVGEVVPDHGSLGVFRVAAGGGGLSVVLRIAGADDPLRMADLGRLRRRERPGACAGPTTGTAARPAETARTAARLTRVRR